MEVFIASSVVAGLPASSKKLGIYSDAQKQHGICKHIRNFCSTSWPTKERTPLELKPHWKVKQSFSMCDDLLMFNCRIVVPKALKKETLEKIHQGHQGIAMSTQDEKLSMVARDNKSTNGIDTELHNVLSKYQTQEGTSPDFAIARIPMASGSN